MHTTLKSKRNSMKITELQDIRKIFKLSMNQQNNLNVIYQNILNSEQVKYLNAKLITYIYMYNDNKHGQAL